MYLYSTFTSKVLYIQGETENTLKQVEHIKTHE